jgi:hypothetical protein
MRHCNSCVYRDSPDKAYPCVECYGTANNYMHDSSVFEAGALVGGDIYTKAEEDPFGVSLNTPGAKADANKPRVDLIFDGMPLALLEVARVATFGAAKYSEHGWLQVPNGFQRYTAAMDRHRLQEGEFIDRDSGIAHAAHCAWNSLARLELLLREGAGK